MRGWIGTRDELIKEAVGETTCRVNLSSSARKRLWSESGGYCGNPSCRKYLFPDDLDVDPKEVAGAGLHFQRGWVCQLEIERASRPRARVLCVGLEDGECFDAEDVDSYVEGVTGTHFIVVVPTRITHAAYERAEERGVCVAGFGELLDALSLDDDISQHIDSRESYERRRLVRNKAVTSLKRKGHHVYEVRRKRLRPLVIITTDEYEFTVDRLYNLLDSYDGVAVDVIVIANPSCYGLSTDSRKAAEWAGVSLALFGDFLDRVGTNWT